jgi:hypothetical protein
MIPCSLVGGLTTFGRDIVPSSSSLKMEEAGNSQTLVTIYQATRCPNPENYNVNHSGNLKYRWFIYLLFARNLYTLTYFIYSDFTLLTVIQYSY